MNLPRPFSGSASRNPRDESGMAASLSASPDRDIAERKLGAIASPIDPRTVRLRDFVQLSHPATFDNSGKVSRWGMLANNRKGCCVVSGYGHLDMLGSTLAGTPNVPTDEEILGVYDALTGGQDVGLVIQRFLSWARHNLFEGRRLLGYAFIDPRDVETCKTAISMFGAVMRGIMLPRTAQTQAIWDVPANMGDPNAQPGSWGGHLTLDVGYDASAVKTVTWGYVQPVTWRFYQTYSMESWALIPLYRVPGFDFDGFVAALRAIGAQVDVDTTDPNPPQPQPQPTPVEDLNARILRELGPITGVDVQFAKGVVWPLRIQPPS